MNLVTDALFICLTDLFWRRPGESNWPFGNRTPIVRLCSAIEHNRTHKKILSIELNRQEMQFEQNRTGFGSIAFDFVRLRSILLDLFDNRIHTKLYVRLCSIAERNRTLVVDCVWLFFVRFCSIRHPGRRANPRIVNGYQGALSRGFCCFFGQNGAKIVTKYLRS